MYTHAAAGLLSTYTHTVACTVVFDTSNSNPVWHSVKKRPAFQRYSNHSGGCGGLTVGTLYYVVYRKDAEKNLNLILPVTIRASPSLRRMSTNTTYYSLSTVYMIHWPALWYVASLRSIDSFSC